MKYIRILSDEEKNSKENYNKLLNEFKIELCKFHDNVLIMHYNTSEKEFRDNTLFAIELFIDVVEKRIDMQLELTEELEKDLLIRFNWLRKRSNKSIRSK